MQAFASDPDGERNTAAVAEVVHAVVVPEVVDRVDWFPAASRAATPSACRSFRTRAPRASTSAVSADRRLSRHGRRGIRSHRRCPSRPSRKPSSRSARHPIRPARSGHWWGIETRGSCDHHDSLRGTVARGVERIHTEGVVRAARQPGHDGRRPRSGRGEGPGTIEPVADDARSVGRRRPRERDGRRGAHADDEVRRGVGAGCRRTWSC